MERPEVASRVMLERLAAKAIVEPKPARLAHNGGLQPFDIDAFITRFAIIVIADIAWNGGRKITVECPFDPSHTGRDAALFIFPSGAIAFRCFHDSCARYEWADVREHFEPGYRYTNGHANGFAGFEGSDRTDKTDKTDKSQDGDPFGGFAGPRAREHVKHDFSDWADWTPLAERESPPDIPIAIVPRPFRAWVADVCERMHVPVGFVAVPLVVAFGSVVGRQIAVRPKERDDWFEVPNIWGLVISEPGTMKSPAESEAFRGINALVEQYATEHRRALAQYDIDAREARRTIKRDERMLAGKKLPADSDYLKQEIEGAERVLATPPVRRSLVVNDSTPEALAVLMEQNPTGFLIQRDELSGLLKQFEKKGHEDALKFYLEGWNGKNHYDVKRIGRETKYIEALCFSVFGTLQPGPARAFVAGAIGGDSDDGFIQRFQLPFVSEDNGPWVDVDREPDTVSRQSVLDIFAAADGLNTDGLSEREGPVAILRFTPEAQSLFGEWRKPLEDRLRSHTERSAFVGYLAKHRKTVPTLALLFHLADTLGSGSLPPISAQAFTLAAAWAEVLEEHARWLYGDQPRMSAVRALARRVERGHIPDGMTVRDLIKKDWSQLTSRDKPEQTLDDLALLGWIRIEKVDTGGRPSSVIRLHPDFREQK